MTDTLGGIARDFGIAAISANADVTVALVAGGRATVASARRHVAVRTRRLSNAISASAPTATPAGPQVDVGPVMSRAFYGHFIERGVPQRAATPFMEPASKDGGDEVSKVLITALGKRLTGGFL